MGQSHRFARWIMIASLLLAAHRGLHAESVDEEPIAAENAAAAEAPAKAEPAPVIVHEAPAVCEEHEVGGGFKLHKFWHKKKFDCVECTDALKEKPFTSTVNVNGVFQLDAGWFEASPGTHAAVNSPPTVPGDTLPAAGVDFRRARLSARGKAWENIDYVIQMDFAFPGRPTFTDVYFDIIDLPYFGHARFGQWKQPIGLEELTSFRFNPFLERSSIFLFNPFRRTGMGIYDWSEDMNTAWFFSVFRDGQDQFAGDYGFTGGTDAAGRISHVFQYEDEGEKLIHVGASYHVRAPTDHRLQYGAFGGNAPEFGLIKGTLVSPSFVNTGVMMVDFSNSYNAELAIVRGPLSIQAEAVYNNLSQMNGNPGLDFWGGYLFATYFLTGEHRPYDRRFGIFDRIRPRNNFKPVECHGWCGGAWETTARLSYIDLTSNNIRGGVLTDATLGLNWYINPYTKFMFNYIHSWLDDRTTFNGSNANTYAVRAQVDF